MLLLVTLYSHSSNILSLSHVIWHHPFVELRALEGGGRHWYVAVKSQGTYKLRYLIDELVLGMEMQRHGTEMVNNALSDLCSM